MNFDTISMLYKLEAMEEDNPFLPEQRNELVEIMMEVDKLSENTMNPIKIANMIKTFKSLEKKYIELFEKYGGNADRLNKKLREYEAYAMGIKGILVK